MVTLSIQDNINKIKSKIDSAVSNRHNDNGEITIIGVTKSVSSELAATLISGGINNIGENRFQEFNKKEKEICELIPDTDFKLHFIGHLQTNKIKNLIKSNKLNLIQSVDSEKLIIAINKNYKENSKFVDMLLEVKTSSEESKYGINPEELIFLSKKISKLENVRVKGLMTMAPFTDDKNLIKSSFDLAWDLYTELKSMKLDNFSMEHLSMGMSGDFEQAIKSGSNMVRIGRAFFDDTLL